MGIDIRTISSDQHEAWQDVLAHVFGFEYGEGDREVWRDRAEFDRCLAAWDGDEIVGTNGSLTFGMTVPGGGVLRMGGVTAAAVKPTHRRRGIFARLMGLALDDIRDRDEPLAALWASESNIYGRYGFGTAIESTRITLDRAHTRIPAGPPGSGRVRSIDVADARRVLPGIYERSTAGIPGTVTRGEADWGIYFVDPEHWREGATAALYAVYERDGEAVGYVRYRLKEKWEDFHPEAEMEIGDLHATDGEAYVALYRFCFEHDLVATIKVHNCRLREPVVCLLAEPRRAVRRPADTIWLRLMDVPAALAARRYPEAGEIVIGLVDGFRPENDGAYLLTGGPDGAECARSDREPDLTMSAADLGSIYLGDSRLPALAWLGRVDGDRDAVLRAHRMFHWDEEPWCTVNF